MSDEQFSSEFYDPEHSPSLKSWGEPADLPQSNVFVECGWGSYLRGLQYR